MSDLLNLNASADPAPIGVFDSGVGGITVLRSLYRHLPQETFLYFGDTARLPYGIRSEAEILQYVREILTWMQQQGTKMVVMACNTSSALALKQVQDEFPMPILGLILPAARAAARQGRRVGVISTPATAASHAYRNAIRECDPGVEVFEVGCPEFVPLIEANRIHEPATRQIVAGYLQPLIEQGMDCLVYGCTHYPHLAPVITSLLPREVQLVDPAEHVCRAIAGELEALALTSHRAALPTRFGVSGDPQQFSRTASLWLGFEPPVEAVALPRLSSSESLPQRVLE